MRRATDQGANNQPEQQISIHALLAESDGLSMLYDTTALIFLSTLSLRRATVGQKRLRQKLAISIHALLAESDNPTRGEHHASTQFLSTLSLRRATGPLSGVPVRNLPFLSTLSLRRATDMSSAYPAVQCISIHALLAESDHYGWSWYDDFTEFLSTLSLRRATKAKTALYRSMSDFYPRSPCGERLCGY